MSGLPATASTSEGSRLRGLIAGIRCSAAVSLRLEGSGASSVGRHGAGLWALQYVIGGHEHLFSRQNL